MKKTILNLGNSLNKSEQKLINGGNEYNSEHLPNRQGCYNEPVSNVNCVSPWVYVSGCGYTCMTEPMNP